MKVEIGLGAKGLIRFSIINYATRHKAKGIGVKYAIMKTNTKVNRITCGPTLNKLDLKHIAKLCLTINSLIIILLQLLQGHLINPDFLLITTPGR